MSQHGDHKFSVTIHTDDLAVVYCLRALAKISQKAGNNNIPWGGTTDKAWERDGHKVTFRFSTPSYRDGLIAEVERLLPKLLWTVIGKRDDDPAAPQGVARGL